MDIQTLLNFGFDVVGGQIDYKGKNYGFMSPDGPVLTPDAEQVVLALAARVADRMENGEAEVKPVRAKPVKAAPKAVVAEAAGSSVAGFDLDD